MPSLAVAHTPQEADWYTARKRIIADTYQNSTKVLCVCVLCTGQQPCRLSTHFVPKSTAYKHLASYGPHRGWNVERDGSAYRCKWLLDKLELHRQGLVDDRGNPLPASGLHHAGGGPAAMPRAAAAPLDDEGNVLRPWCVCWLFPVVLQYVTPCLQR